MKGNKMGKKLLLIWESIPETTEAFILDVDSEIGHAALGSAGCYLNSIEEYTENAPINKLNELLTEEESVTTDFPISGPFEHVIVCGFVL